MGTNKKTFINKCLGNSLNYSPSHEFSSIFYRDIISCESGQWSGRGARLESSGALKRGETWERGFHKKDPNALKFALFRS